VELSTQNRQCTFQIRAVPLPPAVTELLDENASLLAVIEQAQGRDDRKAVVHLNDQTLEQIRHLRERLNEEFIAANDNLWNANTVDEIWSFGPHKCGPNLLLSRIPNSVYRQDSTSIWKTALNNQQESTSSTSLSKDEYDRSIVNGFQLATAKGSLCDEPLMGVAFIIERWTIDTIVSHDEQSEAVETTDVVDSSATIINAVDEVESVMETLSIISDESSALQSQQKPRRVVDQSKIVVNRGPLSGQIVSTIRDGCRKAFDSQPRRLVAAMYKCELMVTTEALGRWKESNIAAVSCSHCLLI
jgi:ribosome assembly protein 1